MFKILDKQGGEVTSSQQAVFNKISTNNADGYVDGFLNNLNMAVMSSNIISIDSGLLSIQGFRSVNDTLATYTVSVTPSEPIPFQLVATYSHYISDENDTLEITTRPTQELRREPLFAGQNAVYEVELAEFTMTADGITDFTVTLEKIVYNEQDLSELLDKVLKAEEDSEYARKLVEELKTQVIEKQGTAVYVNGAAQERVDFTSDPQTQLDGKQPSGDYALKSEIVGADLLWSGSFYGNMTIDLPTYSDYKYLLFWVNNTNAKYFISLSTEYEFGSGVGVPKDKRSFHGGIIQRSGQTFSIYDIGFANLGETSFTSRKETYAADYQITRIYGVK